jgi:hypothetical protein
MFDTLSDKLQVALGDLRDRGVLRKVKLVLTERWEPTCATSSGNSESPRGGR